MDLINEALSLIQNGIVEKLSRDEVLHILASRFTHEKLVEAYDILKSFIGYKADLEDVVQQLAFCQHPDVENLEAHRSMDCNLVCGTCNKSMMASCNQLNWHEMPRSSSFSADIVNRDTGMVKISNSCFFCEVGTVCKSHTFSENFIFEEKLDDMTNSINLVFPVPTSPGSRSVSSACYEGSSIIPLIRKVHRTPSLNSSIPDTLKIVHKPMLKNSTTPVYKESGTSFHYVSNIDIPKKSKLPVLHIQKSSIMNPLKGKCGSVSKPVTSNECEQEHSLSKCDVAVSNIVNNKPSKDELMPKYSRTRVNAKLKGKNFIARNISNVSNRFMNQSTRINAKTPKAGMRKFGKVKGKESKDNLKQMDLESSRKTPSKFFETKLDSSVSISSISSSDKEMHEKIKKSISFQGGMLHSDDIKEQHVSNLNTRSAVGFFYEDLNSRCNSSAHFDKNSFCTSTPNNKITSRQVPDGWVILKGRGIAVPVIALKMWKLVRMYGKTLPRFFEKKSSSWVHRQSNDCLHVELKNINHILEQIHVRLEWVLPAIGELYLTEENDQSVVCNDLQEEVASFGKFIAELHVKCIHTLSTCQMDKKHSEAAGSSCTVAASLISSSSDRSFSVDSLHVVPQNLKIRHHTNLELDTGLLNIKVDHSSSSHVKDDLLCWMSQALNAGMDDELILYVISSHYSLQEVHQARERMAFLGRSLSCMKGIHGMLKELLLVFKDLSDENHNLLKFSYSDINNRPLVQPVHSRVVDRNLKLVQDLAQELTTLVCWVLPEAKRYSEAMEDAGIGSLNVQLTKSRDELSTLKKMLLWELGTVVCDTDDNDKGMSDVDHMDWLPPSWPSERPCSVTSKSGFKVHCAQSCTSGHSSGYASNYDLCSADLCQTAHPAPVTTPQPPERPWIRLVESDLSKPSCIFTVMCYNVLCDKYATRQMYGYCPSWALDWDYRKKGIMDEIKHYLADIITLQEVETDQFYNFFLPELKNEGYEGIFSPKSRAKHMTESERKYVDGCAIFWRTNKFALVKERLIEFNQLAMANHDGSEDMLNRVMTKDNIGLAALLETKEAAWENSVLPDKSQINQHILVCTAHIHWDPEFRDVKLIQTIMLMSEIRQIITQIVDEFQNRTRSGRKLDPNAIQLLLCGDLNSLPESGVVEFLTKGNVSMDHEDFKGFGYKTCLQKIAMANQSNPSLVNTNSNIYTHSFRLSAAYDFSIMAYTNYTYDFKGIIDYIFLNSDTMTALGVLGPIDPEWFRENKVMGCPHPHIPSDHFPLLVQLEMRPATSTLNHPNGLLHR